MEFCQLPDGRPLPRPKDTTYNPQQGCPVAQQKGRFGGAGAGADAFYVPPYLRLKCTTGPYIMLFISERTYAQTGSDKFTVLKGTEYHVRKCGGVS